MTDDPNAVVRDVTPNHILEEGKELDDPSYIGAPVVIDAETGEVHVRPTEK